jgi:hypothetical protein
VTLQLPLTDSNEETLLAHLLITAASKPQKQASSAKCNEKHLKNKYTGCCFLLPSIIFQKI